MRVKEIGVKICGVTRPQDARLAVELGANLIGLNFWPRSPRFLTVEQAEPIVRTVLGEVKLVGVWVNAPAREVESTAARLDLDLLQFHGGETPADLERFGNRAIKAFRVGLDFDVRQLDSYPTAWGFLFDGASVGSYGGTGSSWAYERIAEVTTSKPIFVAGGLGPDNVGDAIARSGADFVDVCSGVESSPGIKDPVLMRRFIHEVRNAQKKD